ncbi:MAG: hypothetical protein QF609_06915, partial [Gammaproteobacteria bacterium]|nr:hypothetical protein [Gammaproteobacteria bacterium]
NLTFWDRKETAQKVGRGSVTEVLERLELVKLNKNAALANELQRKQFSKCREGTASTQACFENALKESRRKGRTRPIVIGHSFGGAVVYSAVSQVLKDRHFPVKSSPNNPGSSNGNNEHAVEGFGDLVVLINPAFEANFYSTLENMTNEKRTYSSHQRPVLAILTSEADDATGKAFPAGRWFSTIFETERTVKTKSAVNPKEQRTINQGQ